MNSKTQSILIPGPSGALSLAIDLPEGDAPQGFGVIAHPHPLFGGNRENKVVQTLCRAFLQRGMVSLRPNFRGVGQSEGVHDAGRGEIDDLFAVWRWAHESLATHCTVPIGPRRWAAGFSFGASMTTHVLAQWQDRGLGPPLSEQAPSRAVLVGLPTERFHPAPLDARCRLIHGDQDEVCSYSGALAAAQSAGLWVSTLPGAGHFFHGQLQALRSMTLEALSDA
ncbi:MAG: hypothetical protein RLY30_594 [Pseudomonadota bacterium]